MKYFGTTDYGAEGCGAALRLKVAARGPHLAAPSTPLRHRPLRHPPSRGTKACRPPRADERAGGHTGAGLRVARRGLRKLGPEGGGGGGRRRRRGGCAAEAASEKRRAARKGRRPAPHPEAAGCFRPSNARCSACDARRATRATRRTRNTQATRLRRTGRTSAPTGWTWRPSKCCSSATWTRETPT